MNKLITLAILHTLFYCSALSQSNCISVNPVACEGDCVPVTYIGPQPSTATYSWTNSCGTITNPNAQNPHTACFLSPGLCTLTVVSQVAGAAPQTCVAFIEVARQPKGFISKDTVVCAGHCVPLTVTFTSGAPPFTYVIGDGFSATSHTTSNFTDVLVVCPAVTTTYTLQSINSVNCMAPGPFNQATVTVLPAIVGSVAQNGNTLCAQPANLLYQWYDCNLNQLLSTSQCLTIPQSGCYCVIVGNDLCKDTVCAEYLVPGDCPGCPPNTIQGSDLIVNGDFAAGNTGFTSDYAFDLAGGLTSGEYSIRNSTNLINGLWACLDHTTNLPAGGFLICDGSTNINNYCWRSTVTVTPGSLYRFCAFANNLLVSSQNFPDPVLEVRINGTIIIPGAALTEVPDNWVLLAGTWTATSTTALIEIRSTDNNSFGNDFALDDISFRECALPDKCDQISAFVEQLHTIPPNCCSRLFFDNYASNCFTQIHLQLNSATFTNVSVDSLNGWAVSQPNPDEILLTHNAGFIPVGNFQTPVSWCVVGGSNPDTLTVVFKYFANGVVGTCDTAFVFSCPVVDACPNNIVQNGSFEQGTPTASDEDIGLATNWSGIWTGGSTGDFYNTVSPLPPGTPPLPVSQNNFGSFWCRLQSNQPVWREGIMNQLASAISQNSGCYQLSLKLACLDFYFGTPSVSIFGVPVGATSTGTPGALAPTNPGLFSPPAILLGTYAIPGTCDENFQTISFNFNSTTLPAVGIDRIFITRTDGAFGGVYVAVDDVCLAPAECPHDSCCADFDAFCNLVNQGFTVAIGDSCKVTVTAPQFDSCHWFGTPPDFGDGTPVLQVLVPANGMWMHTYAQSGTYNICVTVYEQNGSGDFCWHKQMCTPVTVADCTPADSCCLDHEMFVHNVQNAVTFTAIDSLCKAIVNVNGLPACDSIHQIQWGDGHTDFGPFGDGMYMHAYAQSGVYTITVVLVEYNANGQICFDNALHFTIDCNLHNKCDSLSVFVEQLHTIPPNCCSRLFFDNQVDSCFTQIHLQLSSGNFTNVNVDAFNGWSFSQPNAGELVLTHNSGFIPVGFFQGPLSWCVTGGTNPHTLTVNFQFPAGGAIGACDTSFAFNCPIVDTCCADRERFCQNVQNAVTLISDNALCKATLAIGALPDCDYIEHVNWGDGNADFGPFTGGAMVMHTYLQSGTYIISYLAIETDPNTGLICFEKLFRDTITLNCGGLCPDNLVPNPSFEQFTTCPTGLFQLPITFWTSPTGASPDYYNSCATLISGAGVPFNIFGSQGPRTGAAYVGFILRPFNVYREYLEVPLNSPLVAGTTYQVSFYVSLADQSRWAIDKMGAYLSVGPVGPIPGAPVLPLTPQVANPPGNYISSKTAWTLVSGQYVALGGEDHLVVGNFNDNASTVVASGLGGFYLGAYYYLDDVSVCRSSPVATQPDLEGKELTVYPNPANGFIEVDLSANVALPVGWEMFDALGRAIARGVLAQPSGQLTLGNDTAPGVYYLRFKTADRRSGVVKVVLVK